MWLNLFGCQAVQRNDNLTVKNTKNAFLTVNCPYIGQPDDHQ